MTVTVNAPSASALEQPRVMMASGNWCFEADGGERISPRFAPEPAHVAANVMERLRWLESSTGRRHVVCGLIPFAPHVPSSLTMTDAARFRPRGRRSVPHTHSDMPRRAVPDSPEYRGYVSQALRRIAAGEVEKVVLARTMDIPLPASVSRRDLGRVMAERLAAADETADIYAVTDDDDALWVGASPEVVADVSRGRFMTHPLAGSVSGEVPYEQARQLLENSHKDQHEHAHVVRHIDAALAPLTRSRHVPERPSLHATDTMWHLGTRISGHLHPGVSALEVAVALHPTPAVCGTPTNAAASLIEELEPTPRLSYAGLVGWSDSSGDGRWSLVLRGARVGQEEIRLYAGAGIVAGSDPQAEHDETAAKFATVLRCLEGLT